MSPTSPVAIPTKRTRPATATSPTGSEGRTRSIRLLQEVRAHAKHTSPTGSEGRTQSIRVLQEVKGAALALVLVAACSLLTACPAWAARSIDYFYIDASEGGGSGGH